MAGKSAKKSPAAKPPAAVASSSRSLQKTAVPPSLGTWLLPAYLALMLVGYTLFRAGGAMTAGQEMGAVKGLFTAVNLATLTGFRQVDNIQTYHMLGQICAFGMILFGSLFTLIIGATAMSRILRLGYSDGRIVRAAIVAEAAAIAVGTFVLLFDRDRTFWQAIFMAASAFGNCGAVIGTSPSANSWQTHGVILPLAAAGGLGLCVLMEIFDRLRSKKEKLSEHASASLACVVWLYIGGTFLLVLVDWSTSSDWRELMASSAAVNLASRTLGMGLADVPNLSHPAFWCVMLLMMIGACAGGTAGGVKATSILAIFRGGRYALAGRTVGRSLGIALVWVGMYLLLIIAAFLLLLQQMPETSADRVLFLTISAASNVGLSEQALSPDPKVAYILCVTMIIGRFAPLLILWWTADTTQDAQLAVG